MSEQKEGLLTPVKFNEVYISRDLLDPHISNITIPKAIIEEENSELWAYSYNGCGKITFKNGMTYSGSMAYGVMSTENDPRGCVITFPNGTRYEGEIKNNQLLGKGTYSFPSGAKYTGDIRYGLRHGYGLYTSADGIMYEGEWSRGKKEGIGKMIKGDMMYEGEFKDGLIGGLGKLTWNNGNSYEGHFKNNVIHGNGTMLWAESNEKYTGRWKNNLQNGYGVYIWYETENQRYLRNRYVGQWKDGLRNGYGVFFYSNGTRYEGLWKDNEKHGYGVFHFLNGAEYKGRFEHDRMIDYDSCGLVNTINTHNELFTNPNVNKHDKTSTGTKTNMDSRKEENKMDLPMIQRRGQMNKELEVIMENEITPNKKPNNNTNKDKDKGKDKAQKGKPIAKPQATTTTPTTKPTTAKPKPETHIKAKSSSSSNIEQSSSDIAKKTYTSPSSKPTTNNNNAPRTIKETSISFLASTQGIIESESNQFKSMIDIIDILETSTTIEDTSKEIYNALLRNLTEMKHWYYKLIRGDKPGEEIFDINASRMGMGISNAIQRGTSFAGGILGPDEPQIDLNANEEKTGNEFNTLNSYNNSDQAKDDKIGLCMEMKDLWRFFRDYGIVSIDMSIAQFNRLFYRGAKNIAEMFNLPDDIPRIKLYDYMYFMISKAHLLFKEKYAQDLDDIGLGLSKTDKRKLTSCEMFNYYDTDAHMDKDLISFDYHNQHNTILIRQFYEAIVRAAYLRFFDYNVPLYQKIEMLISKFSMRNMNRGNTQRLKTVNKSNTSNSFLSSNMGNTNNNDVSIPLLAQMVNSNMISPDQKQKNAEHALIDTFMSKYDIHIKPIFRKLCAKYSKGILNRPSMPIDMVITYRYLYDELIQNTPLLKEYYPDKKSLCDVINYYFKEKRNDLKTSKEIYEYYEALMDLEMTFYEFCEWMYFMTQKHLMIRKADGEGDGDRDDNADETKVILEVIDIVHQSVYQLKDANVIKKPAKEKRVFPILVTHVIKQRQIDERLRREHEELLRKLEKERYTRERKEMEIEGQSNAYLEEIPQVDDEDDDLDNSYY